MSNEAKQQPRILKIADCKSLSGRTDLTYHVGCAGVNEVCFRIWSTSGKGIFSKEWIPATEIQKVLAQHERITGPSLLPVFKVGRSVNTAGYLLAALKHEGLVTLSDDMPHKYVRVQSDAFVKEVAELMKSGVSLDASAVAAASKPKGRATKKAPAWEVAAKEGEASTEKS